MTTDPQPAPPPAPAPAPAAPGFAGWLVEGTLVLVVAAHALSALAMRLTAAAMPLFFVDACVVGPLGLGLTVLGAREANRRTSRRGRLVLLVLLCAASTSLVPWLSGANLTAGAQRDLGRAGGAEQVVAEGRALMARWLAEGRPAGTVTPAEWPTAHALGAQATWDPGEGVRIKSFGFGPEFHGFVVLAPDAAPVGRPLADGLAWWSDAEHGPRRPR